MNCANHSEREHVSFCQNCGKPLCSQCTRAIGAGVFCEPCLAARLAAADAAARFTPGYSASSPGGTVSSPGLPPIPGSPNPVLAGALGFIPGVAAMYNGQYAKAVVHLIVFTLLVSLAADANGAFGMLVAGWIFYQVFEGYHTARARRDGTPLPNPFGLNDIGERFGFGKAWPSPVATPPPSAAADASAAYAPQPGPVFTQSADGSQSFVASDGTHFRQGADGSHSYGGPGTYGPSTWGAPAETYIPPVPPTPPFGAAYAAPYVEPPFDGTRNRFPAGAVWLIALGLLFFFGSSGVFRHFPIQKLIPFVLIGFGVWVFFRKMASSGQTMTDDGSSAYRLRLFRALRGSVWLVLVGVLFFLDTFDILSWGHSWPLFIITAGVMTLFERSVYNNAAATVPYVYPAAGSAPQAPAVPAPAAADTSTVPPHQHDEEGR